MVKDTFRQSAAGSLGVAVVVVDFRETVDIMERVAAEVEDLVP